MQTFKLSLLIAAIFSLGACKTIMNPTFMPSGYKYHQNNYKSPPGPEADKPCVKHGEEGEAPKAQIIYDEDYND
ncbi:MAG: hypothetical protein ACRBCT_08440 [Alphaproteobacteria bacterium]